MSGTLAFALAPILYTVSAASFIVGLKSIAKVRTAARGRLFVAAGFALAVVAGIVEQVGLASAPSGGWAAALVAGLIVGAVLGGRVSRSAAPSGVGFIPALGGAAVLLLAIAWLRGRGFSADVLSTSAGVAALLAATGGLMAFVFGLAGQLSAGTAADARVALAATAAGFGAGLLGFSAENIALLVVGGTAATAGLAAGRLVVGGPNLLAAALGGGGGAGQGPYGRVRSCGTEEAAMVLETAGSVLIVPGFGMAAAQAQHAVKELAEQCEKRGARVRFAVHPAAGCLPGHINIALDEANVPHEQIVTLEDAQKLVPETDVVLVVGANDIVNPAASSEPGHPLDGLDVLHAERARNVIVVKRSLAPGQAGTPNPLFAHPSTTIVFGDAKRVAQALVSELKGATH